MKSRQKLLRRRTELVLAVEAKDREIKMINQYLDHLEGQHYSHMICRTIPGLRVATISCGFEHSLLATCDGTLFSWGRGTYGRLGHGNDVNPEYAPRQVFSVRDKFFRVVAASTHHSAALTIDGELYTWGSNEHGKLGLGDSFISTSVVSLPTKITSFLSKEEEGTEVESVPVISICLGDEHGLLITAEKREVYSWGNGADGRLGHKESMSRRAPKCIEVMRGRNVKQISAGQSHSAAVSVDGYLYTWGLGRDGQLGHGDKYSRNKPKCVFSFIGTKIDLVECGYNHTICVTSLGLLFSFGLGLFGALGHGKLKSCKTPTLVSLPEDAGECSMVSAGLQYTLAVMKNGDVYAWGHNSCGQLGIGELKERETPLVKRRSRDRKLRLAMKNAWDKRKEPKEVEEDSSSESEGETEYISYGQTLPVRVNSLCPENLALEEGKQVIVNAGTYHSGAIIVNRPSTNDCMELSSNFLQHALIFGFFPRPMVPAESFSPRVKEIVEEAKIKFSEKSQSPVDEWSGSLNVFTTVELLKRSGFRSDHIKFCYGDEATQQKFLELTERLIRRCHMKEIGRVIIYLALPGRIRDGNLQLLFAKPDERDRRGGFGEARRLDYENFMTTVDLHNLLVSLSAKENTSDRDNFSCEVLLILDIDLVEKDFDEKVDAQRQLERENRLMFKKLVKTMQRKMKKKKKESKKISEMLEEDKKNVKQFKERMELTSRYVKHAKKEACTTKKRFLRRLKMRRRFMSHAERAMEEETRLKDAGVNVFASLTDEGVGVENAVRKALNQEFDEENRIEALSNSDDEDDIVEIDKLKKDGASPKDIAQFRLDKAETRQEIANQKLKSVMNNAEEAKIDFLRAIVKQTAHVALAASIDSNLAHLGCVIDIECCKFGEDESDDDLYKPPPPWQSRIHHPLEDVQGISYDILGQILKWKKNETNTGGKSILASWHPYFFPFFASGLADDMAARNLSGTTPLSLYFYIRKQMRALLYDQNQSNNSGSVHKEERAEIIDRVVFLSTQPANWNIIKLKKERNPWRKLQRLRESHLLKVRKSTKKGLNFTEKMELRKMRERKSIKRLQLLKLKRKKKR
eukprot:g2320.t1